MGLHLSNELPYSFKEFQYIKFYIKLLFLEFLGFFLQISDKLNLFVMLKEIEG